MRAQLPRTFGAFLGRFAHPTEVQTRGIPPILAGKDTLLCAPTATGKTEAYAAPLVERVLAGPKGGVRLLLVSPTRALANDLKRRLEVRMDDVGVPFGRYTGEHKERAAGKLPIVVVTTPEALDSLLARRPRTLRDLVGVVLDEIHILDGTPRGDQLRILLHRLERVTERPVQRVAASATVAAPEDLAARYLSEAEIVATGGSRTIRAKAFDGAGLDDVARHLNAIARQGFRKVLCFCNSRNDVERFAAGLRNRTAFGDKVYPHHGSLARRVRERTERLFLESTAAVCAATLTLELGIDIGTVDYVLLLGVPPSVENLTQRIGRGSRRGDTIRVGYACAHPGEELLYRVLFSLSASGRFCADPYAFRPGVFVQQAMVLAGAEDYVTARRLDAISPPEIRSGLPAHFSRELLAHLAEKKLLESAGRGRYVLSEAADRKYERGVLHSNIDSGQDLPVVDRLTGEIVGEVAPREGRDSRRLQIAGAGRREVRIANGRLLTDGAAGGEPARFQSRPLPGMAFHLAREIAGELGAKPNQLVLRRGGGGFILLHGLGAVGGLLLRESLTPVVGKARIGDVTPITLQLSKPIDRIEPPEKALAAGLLASRERRLAALAGMGPYHRFLPKTVRLQALRGAVHLDGVLDFLSRAALIKEEHRAAPRVWELL